MHWFHILFTIYLSGLFTLTILELTRFVFAAEPWPLKAREFSVGMAHSFFWIIMAITPLGRLHFAKLFRFSIRSNPS